MYSCVVLVSIILFYKKAAETLLDLALYDENKEVRYEAMLQYHSHPKAAEQPIEYTRYVVVLRISAKPI